MCGVAAAGTGTNYGVYGSTSSFSGYAGYFEGGRNYFEGDVGIGTESPNYDLHVIGNRDRAIYGTTSGTYGVFGQSTRSNGKGVYGYATTTEGVNYGVFGETPSGQGYAG